MTLKGVRLKMRLTQKELGELLGISQTTVSLLETGRYNPNPKTARKVEAKLGEIIHWPGYSDTKPRSSQLR